MNRKLKAKWIKALRSGSYRQGDGALCNAAGDKFCCLGVLADIQGFRWRLDDDNELIPVYPKSNRAVVPDSGNVLPVRVAGGLSREVQEELANMNDGAGQYYPNRKSFLQIADYIEQNL